MKFFGKILLIVALLFPAQLLASDMYEQVAQPKWKHSFVIFDNVNVKSLWKISNNKIEMMKTTYALIKKAFFSWYGLDPTECKNAELNVKIVDEHILDDRHYFPDEEAYAGKGEIVFGRYYRDTNVLYIVPPNLKKYYWKEDFAHELAHHFFNDCGIIFINSADEHAAMERFLDGYKEN